VDGRRARRARRMGVVGRVMAAVWPGRGAAGAKRA
jgi:hypothetical protein